MSKKIMIITCHTQSLFWFRLDMMKRFVDEGYSVIAVGNESEEKWSSVFSNYHITYKSVFVKRNGINPIIDFKTKRHFFKIIKKEMPDIVFTYNAKAIAYANLASKKYKIPTFSLIAGIGSLFLSNSLKTRVLRFILCKKYKKSLSLCEKVIFQNSDDANLFLNKKLVQNHQVEMVPGSGVNLNIFKQEALPKKLSFLFVGRLIKDKGLIEYLESCKIIKEKYKEVVFKVVGPFDSNPSSIKYIDIKPYIDNNIIEFYGEQSNVLSFYKDSSVFVLPSYREGTPKTILEAMATGRPIITTDVPGCRQTIIDGLNGFLVPAKNIQQLCEKMELFINNYDLCKKMGEESRVRAEKIYDVNIVNDRIIEIIETRN